MRKLLHLALAVLFCIMSIADMQAQPNIDEGKALFKAKCAQCHNKNMRDKLTGPALGGTEERWADYPREDLYSWIRNSQALIAEGHPYATAIFSEWNNVVMNSNADLTDEQIEGILAYIDDVYVNGGKVAVTEDGSGGAEQGGNSALFWWLIGGLVLLSIVLAQILGTLRNVIRAKETGAEAKPVSMLDIFTNRMFLSIVTLLAIIIGGSYLVNSAINVGRQQNYAPKQPIAFSHKTHAGQQQIDCKYCHDGARRSKSSVIPAANTCMNCHKAIKVGSKHGTAELTKIYASIGFDPISDKYIEDYEAMPEEDVEALYKKWIALTYLGGDDKKPLDKKGERLVADQWMDIQSSLTTDLKPSVKGPIPWIRIHNLPDHVYFNHQQHVTVGGLDCVNCHGKVEEMDVLAQHAPLSMGWCINCHRQTEVDGFKNGNGYYAETYKAYHEALAIGDKDKVTVADIGGLECQKCHF